MQQSFVHEYSTVEPLIENPPKKGQPPNKEVFWTPSLLYIAVYYNLEEKTPLTRDKMVSNTVEPPIKDPPRKGHLPNKVTLFWALSIYIM